jgi:hypothetical protein
MVKKYHVVMTNVPYLGRGKQGDTLYTYLEQRHPLAKADLATAFLDRISSYILHEGTAVVVSPESWWFQSGFKDFRVSALKKWTWTISARLGEEAWQSFGQRGPRATLLIFSLAVPPSSHEMLSINLAKYPTIAKKN